jgi:mono/diheme cytochrome c family protein
MIRPLIWFVALASSMLAAGIVGAAQGAAEARVAPAAARSGAEVYRAACITCHGPDGRGNPRSHVGFDVPLPDFTDCKATTPEVEADWFAIVYNGGPVRAFDRHMPSFGEALSEGEIRAVVHHLRSFCADRAWPPGDLNLPRPLVTEKAFPENEALLTIEASRFGDASLTMAAVYEHRLGARTQWEVNVPVAAQQGDGSGSWSRGLGDLTAAIKHVLFHDGSRGSIVSAGAEMLLPTGSESRGLGKGVAIVEPFVAVGQMLPSNAFLQLHAGIELPADTSKSAREAFWRVAAGRTFFHDRFHREWTPMLELVAAKELIADEHVLWDVVPQVQVSLSRRHHVLASGGVQVPVNERDGRGRTFRMYVLWDWFDGGLFSGW